MTRSTTPIKVDKLAQKFGFCIHKKNNPDVILAEDVAVELGHPSTESKAIVLLTYHPEGLENGTISVIGPDLDEMDRFEKYPFAQVVMLSIKKGTSPNPFYVQNAQYLFRRLPGFMVRSVPGKLWVRINKASIENGLRFKTIGSALIAAYANDFSAVANVEVVFVTQSKEDVQALNQIAVEARILSGQHKKLVIGTKGGIECTELKCETCDEKPVCDTLRDVAIKRREQRR